ncbi:MAG TPA: hypothetical protein VL988_01810 [Solirubrobacteraceae bacterium]|nr:hypothetical protein [Solirubrobacteraceae bacterium]
MSKRRRPPSPSAGLPLAIALVSLGPVPGEASARPAASPPAAVVARAVSLNETGHLRLTRKHDFTLYERGTASGTVAGTIYVRLTAVSSSRVTVSVSIEPPGGSISGSGSGSYRRSGTIASFAGSMSFGGGSGKYKGVHGSGLSFSGTIQESHSDAITVYVRGKVSD